jgi:hypothetical protein
VMASSRQLVENARLREARALSYVKLTPICRE